MSETSEWTDFRENPHYALLVAVILTSAIRLGNSGQLAGYSIKRLMCPKLDTACPAQRSGVQCRLTASTGLRVDQVAIATKYQQILCDVIHRRLPASFASENHEREPKRVRVLAILFDNVALVKCKKKISKYKRLAF